MIMNHAEYPHGLKECALCPYPIEQIDDVIILKRRGIIGATKEVVAHLACFERHPIQNLNLLKREGGLVIQTRAPRAAIS